MAHRSRPLRSTRRRRQRTALFAVLVLASLLGPAAAALAQAPGRTERASLRLVPLSPDAPQFDLLIDGKLALKDVDFGAASGYLSLSAGNHEITAFPHRNPVPQGSDAAKDPGPVQPIEPLAMSAQLEPGGYYTLALVGYFDPPPPANELGALHIDVDEGATVEVTGPRGYGVTLDRSATLPRLRPGEYVVHASRPGYQGTDQQVQVESGQTATLAITLQRGGGGQATQAPAPAAVQQQEESVTWHKTQMQLYHDALGQALRAGETWVRVVHSSPTTPGATLTVQPLPEGDGSVATLVKELDYPNATDYLTLPAGRYRLVLTVAGTDYELGRLAVELEPGVIYTLFLVGNNKDNHVDMLPTVDAAGAVP